VNGWGLRGLFRNDKYDPLKAVYGPVGRCKNAFNPPLVFDLVGCRVYLRALSIR
jgi:hypothetical protein